MEEGSIYGRISYIAAAPFNWLVSIARRMRRERRAVTAREDLFALFDYTPGAGHGNQLAFSAGDDFLLRCDDDKNWWLAKHIPSGRKGYVPMSYVERKSEKVHMEWCSLRTSRVAAERILKTDQPGAFIIRTMEGKRFTEALALSVRSKDGGEKKVLHYSIQREQGAFWIHIGRKFPSLTYLVQHYAGHHSAIEQPLRFSVKKRETIEVWMVSPRDIEVDKGVRLGNGNFGMVYKGRLRGEEVAIKTLLLSSSAGGLMTLEQFMREAEIARDFSHKNIVKTIGVCARPAYIITEYLSGGNLKTYLQRKHVHPDDFFLIAQKIACAMAHLEEKEIVHRDLAARNILVGEDHKTIKLADFGLARCIQESEYYETHSNLFPVKWTAPEAFVIDGKKGKSSSKSDVWSFGVVMWEVWSKGAEPYPEYSSAEIYRRLKLDNYRLKSPTGCAPVFHNKMLECWLLTPAHRPTFAELHAFLLDPYGDRARAAQAIAQEPADALPASIDQAGNDVVMEILPSSSFHVEDNEVVELVILPSIEREKQNEDMILDFLDLPTFHSEDDEAIVLDFLPSPSFDTEEDDEQDIPQEPADTFPSSSSIDGEEVGDQTLEIAQEAVETMLPSPSIETKLNEDIAAKMMIPSPPIDPEDTDDSSSSFEMCFLSQFTTGARFTGM